MKKKISLFESLIPVIFLIGLLILNVSIFKDDATYGANQLALLLSAGVAAAIGLFKNVSFEEVFERVSENIKSTATPILILLFVGALAGTWMISGIVPAMIYYGLQILNPTYFLVACVVIASIVSVMTGSSWTTSATIGIALMGIANSLGISEAATAGAVISGAYFGDKMSPLSETTNLAPAMAGTDLYTHIKYMMITTVPTILITLVVFLIIGFTYESTGQVDEQVVLNLIESKFNISPWLFIVPVVVILMILKKVPAINALLFGSLLGAVTAVIAQPQIIQELAGTSLAPTLTDTYKVLVNALVNETVVQVDPIQISAERTLDLQGLFVQGGMSGMLNTIWLIICAMTFGGAMEAIGALERISQFFLSITESVFGLFASTVATCLTLNITASDQYLAIVVPGKMFKDAYDNKNLAPENLSRTLEDSGTVTSALIPWNTCGAYHSQVLLGQAGATAYIPYAVFNYVSPFMTLLVAAIGYKIRMKYDKKKPSTIIETKAT